MNLNLVGNRKNIKNVLLDRCSKTECKNNAKYMDREIKTAKEKGPTYRVDPPPLIF